MRSSITILSLFCLVLLALPAAAVVEEVDGGVAYQVGCNGTYAESHLGSGAWQSNNTGAPYVEYYFYVDSLTLGKTIQVQDIESITYWTKDGPLAPYGSNVDFFLAIYTKPYTGGDSWYGNRINAEPLYANNYSPTAGAWNQWVTDGAANELVWADHNHGPIGAYGGPTLADIKAGPITWSDYFAGADTSPIDYATQPVWLIKVGTGTAWHAGFDGYIDEITLTLTPAAGGDVLTLDLEGNPVHNITQGTDYPTIQLAVDAANPGDVIEADPGTYVEQVHITTDLTLRGAGAGSTIIQSPDTLVEFFGTSNNNYPVVFIQNTANVVLEDLTVDGAGKGNTNYRMVGVGFNNAGGGVYNCDILDIRDTPFSGSQHGVALYVWNDDTVARSVTVDGCTFDGFQKNAMALNSTDTTPLTVTVNNNIINGYGATDITAQNGIQTWSRAITGSITNNTITGIAYDNTAATTKWVASSILNYFSTLTISGNDVSGAHVGVYNYDGAGAITNNTFAIEKIGVYAWGIIASDPPHAVPSPMDNPVASDKERTSARTAQALLTVDISGNSLTMSGPDNTATYGIESDAGFGPDDLDVTVNNNTVTGFEVGLEFYQCQSSCDVGVFTAASAFNNSLGGNTLAMRSNIGYLTVQGSGNWLGSTDAATVQTLVSGDIDYTPYLGSATDTDAGTPGFQGDFSTLYVEDDSPQLGADTRLIEAIGLLTNSTIHLAPGTYAEGPQVVIDKDVTIIGADKNTVTIVPTASTGSSGDARGWFLVQSGFTFNMSEVTLDGAGYQIYQAIRSTGGGTIDNCIFRNINFSQYVGVAAAVFGSLPMDFTNNIFENIERIGVLYFGTGVSGSVFSGNTYTGKGIGDWLDYALDISAGADIDVLNNVVSGNRGVASSDGSTSAGFLITTFFAAGTAADFDGNVVTDNTTGIAVGYDATDGSAVTITNNDFIDNDFGVNTTASPSISLVAYGNFFDNVTNADDDAGGQWDDGASIGNCWSDYDTNAGYPTHYVVGGDAGSIDNYPNINCGAGFSTNDITYDCSGTFSFDVTIGEDIAGMESGTFTMEWPADLALVSVSSGANVFTSNTYTDKATGMDTLLVDVAILSGSLSGPASVFTVELSGATNYCATELISMIFARYRTAANVDIFPAIGAPINFVADCVDPTFTVNGPADGGYYNTAPVLDIAASDNCELDAVYYQVDGCTGGGWQAIATGIGSTNYADAAWMLPNFAALADGNHCIYFKAVDVNGRGNSDSCSFTWCFTKDVVAPSPPTNFTAAPGHNKVKLNWTNPTDPDVVAIRIQRVAWGDYPEYAPPAPNYPADENTGTTVFDALATSHEDVTGLSDATRDIYYYTAFAYDMAGNFSVAVSDAQDRSTSYWLGDLTDAAFATGSYDGFVYFQDLSKFSVTYGKADGDAGYFNEADFGPSHNNSPKGIPVPDDSVGFEDLAIFAINFDAVSPTLKVVPFFAGNGNPGAAHKLTLEAVENDGAYSFALAVDNNVDQLKAFRAVIKLGEGVVFDGAQLNSVIEESETPVFSHVTQSADQVAFDFALLGNGVTVGGSGQIATLRFRTVDGDNPEVELIDGLLRDNDNNPLVVELQTVGVESLPQQYALSQNYPNPFNPTTSIAFDLPHPGEVTLEVYNTIGQRVAVLVDDWREAGSYTIEWDGRDASGAKVASGIYFYRLSAGEYNQTRKMMLLK